MSNQKQQNVSQNVEMTLFSCININVETYVDNNPSTVFNEEIQTVDISSETNINDDIKPITSFVENNKNIDISSNININNDSKYKSIPIYNRIPRNNNIFGISCWMMSPEKTSRKCHVNNNNFVLNLNTTSTKTKFSNIIFDSG